MRRRNILLKVSQWSIENISLSCRDCETKKEKKGFKKQFVFWSWLHLMPDHQEVSAVAWSDSWKTTNLVDLSRQIEK